jgi:hypothetical protein
MQVIFYLGLVGKHSLMHIVIIIALRIVYLNAND